MKKETKELIKRIIILFSPIFTIIMFTLPWICLYKENYEGTINTDVYTQNYSYLELLKSDLSLMTKIIASLTLVGVVTTIVLYILSIVLKDKEKLFTKIGAIILVCSCAILLITSFTKLKSEPITGSTLYKWADFMTLPYGLLMVYNVASLILICKKGIKKD